MTPHESKNKLMPDLMKLNGIEVSFSKTSTNEDHKTHISTKNIIPLQNINPIDNICGFIDVTPPYPNNPNLTIQDIESGKVLFTSFLSIDNSFKKEFLFIKLMPSLGLILILSSFFFFNEKIFRWLLPVREENASVSVFYLPISLPNNFFHIRMLKKKSAY